MRKLFFAALFILCGCVSSKGDDKIVLPSYEKQCQETKRVLRHNLKQQNFAEGTPQADYRQIVTSTESGAKYVQHFEDNVCRFSFSEKGGRNGCQEATGSLVMDCMVGLGTEVRAKYGVNQEFLFFLERVANQAMLQGGQLPRTSFQDKITAELSYLRFLKFLSEEMTTRKRPASYLANGKPEEKAAMEKLAKIEGIYEKEFRSHLKATAQEHFAIVSDQQSLSPEDSADLNSLAPWLRSLK